jgi:hypothetical protein
MATRGGGGAKEEAVSRKGAYQKVQGTGMTINIVYQFSVLRACLDIGIDTGIEI